MKKIVALVLVSLFAFQGIAVAQPGKFKIIISPNGEVTIQYSSAGNGPFITGFGLQQNEVSSGNELLQAVENAREGTTIWLRNARYEISRPLVIDKAISIRARPNTNPVIESSGSRCLDITFGQSVFTGIKFRLNSTGTCVRVQREGTPQFAHCKIEAPQAGSMGILISGRDANPTFHHSEIYDCENECVRVENSGKGRIEDCKIFRNRSTGGVIFSVHSDGNPTVLRCEIHGGAQYGINIDNGKGRFERVQIYNHSSAGVSLRNNSNPTFMDCRIYDNGRENSNYGGVCVIGGSTGLFQDCLVGRNRSHGYAISGDNTNPRILRGHANDNKATGIYVYSNARGRFENVDVKGNSIGYHVISGANPALEGGTVERSTGLGGICISSNGQGRFVQVRVANNQQRGIDVRNGGTGFFDRCNITDNRQEGISVTKGAGTNDRPGKPDVVRCTITNNGDGGIVVWNGGAGRYHTNNSVHNNGNGRNVHGTSLTNFNY